MNKIYYQLENQISLEEFKRVLVNSTLGERRPIDDDVTLANILEYGNLIITAWDDGNLIGVARSLSDFNYCTYLSDLAVDKKYQKMGVGKELIKQTKLASLKSKLILLSALNAVGYYPKIGMKQWEYCYFLDNIEELK